MHSAGAADIQEKCTTLTSFITSSSYFMKVLATRNILVFRLKTNSSKCFISWSEWSKLLCTVFTFYGTIKLNFVPFVSPFSQKTHQSALQVQQKAEALLQANHYDMDMIRDCAEKVLFSFVVEK